MGVKDYTLLEILEYIIEKYPDSCIAVNTLRNHKDYKKYSEEEIEIIFLDELDGFFTFEVIGLCGCGTPEDCKKDIVDLLNIFYNHRIHTEPGSTEALEIKIKAMKDRFNVKNIYENSLLLFMVYMLSDKQLLEHGSSIGGSWITDFGNICRIVYNKSLKENNQNEKSN